MRSDSVSRARRAAARAFASAAVAALSVAEQFPHRRECTGQRWQLAEIAVAFVGTVEIAAARGGEIELERLVGVLDVFG
jgi:hypothetical protein